LSIDPNHVFLPIRNQWFKVLKSLSKPKVRRGAVFLILLRFTLLAVVAAFLAVMARTVWRAVTGGSFPG
jgi:hypothetical protein